MVLSTNLKLLYSHYYFVGVISFFMGIITVCYLDLQNIVIISPRLHSFTLGRFDERGWVIQTRYTH